MRAWRTVAALFCLLLLGAQGSPPACSSAFVPPGAFGGGNLGPGAMSGGATASAPSPTFDTGVSMVSGPSNIPTTLGITGATLVVDCDARTANTATSWPCSTGGTWPIFDNGGGTMSLARTAQFTDPAARAIEWSGTNGDYFIAPNATLGDPGTNDFAVEVVFRALSASGVKGIFGKRASVTTSTDAGWSLRCTSSNCGSIQLSVSDGTNTAGPTASASNANYVAMCFFKAGTAGGAQCFANGVAGSAVSTAAVGSLSNNETLAVGFVNATGGAGNWLDHIAAVKMWTCAGCLSTASYQSIATEHMQRAAGLYPAIASVSAAMTFARASDAFTDADLDDDGIRRMEIVGAGWPRVVQRGGVTGYLSEPTATTNLAARSDTFSSSWTPVTSTVTDNQATAPDGSTTADKLAATSGAGNVAKAVFQSVTLTATSYTFSAWVKASSGNATHAYLYDASIANANGWVKFSDCSAGTKGSALSRLATSSWGNGWCRVEVTFTGTAAGHQVRIGLSNADNVLAYDDGTTLSSIFMWGAQVEAGTYATSYIPTTTAAVTRAADSHSYSGANVATTAGTVEVQFVAPLAPSVNPRLLTISDGSGTNPGIYIDPINSAEARCEYFAGGAAQAQIHAAVTDYGDGALHKMRETFTTNDVRCYFDDAQISTTDTSATMAGPPTVMYVGRSAGGGANGFVITRVRAWPSLRLSPGAIP